MPTLPDQCNPSDGEAKSRSLPLVPTMNQVLCQGLASVRHPAADVVITQAPETFVKLFTGIAEPPALMQSGELNIQGMDNMARYGELFPPPSLDRVIPPMGAAVP